MKIKTILRYAMAGAPEDQKEELEALTREIPESVQDLDVTPDGIVKEIPYFGAN